MKLTKYNVLMNDDVVYIVDATDRFTACKTAMAMARSRKSSTEVTWAKTDAEMHMHMVVDDKKYTKIEKAK